MSPGVGDAATDQRTLATSLAPLIEEACGGRLSDLRWFKADWQRGGAATATAVLEADGGPARPVVLKVPVVERELRWMRRLQDDSDGPTVVPRLYASDDAVGGYDLAWIVIERFPHGPLGRQWHDDHVPRVADAAARFWAAAGRYPVDQPPRVEPWDELVREAIESVKRNRLEPRPRWTAALRALERGLDDVVGPWRARNVDHWLHGDLHLANAMSREASDHGDVQLIDLAEVHAGHWIEDAIYLERQLWAWPERFRAAPPVKTIAAARRRHGLDVEDGYPRLATLRRVLMAGSAPRFVRTEGHPRYLEACLERLEAGLGELKLGGTKSRRRKG
ncbi:MAG: phosphotransferase family protein [Planctomycetota bacterium]